MTDIFKKYIGKKLYEYWMKFLKRFETYSKKNSQFLPAPSGGGFRSISFFFLDDSLLLYSLLAVYYIMSYSLSCVRTVQSSRVVVCFLVDAAKEKGYSSSIYTQHTYALLCSLCCIYTSSSRERTLWPSKSTERVYIVHSSSIYCVRVAVPLSKYDDTMH